mmetsp:Transcript_100852/g.285613  ORF Transcript_100852/g.285613 Transcript_100852/m.285613 type:complete len:324 (+) Transcript_100852:818-1789(+)
MLVVVTLVLVTVVSVLVVSVRVVLVPLVPVPRRVVVVAPPTASVLTGSEVLTVVRDVLAHVFGLVVSAHVFGLVVEVVHVFGLVVVVVVVLDVQVRDVQVRDVLVVRVAVRDVQVRDVHVLDVLVVSVLVSVVSVTVNVVVVLPASSSVGAASGGAAARAKTFGPSALASSSWAPTTSPVPTRPAEAPCDSSACRSRPQREGIHALSRKPAATRTRAPRAARAPSARTAVAAPEARAWRSRGGPWRGACGSCCGSSRRRPLRECRGVRLHGCTPKHTRRRSTWPASATGPPGPPRRACWGRTFASRHRPAPPARRTRRGPWWP